MDDKDKVLSLKLGSPPHTLDFTSSSLCLSLVGIYILYMLIVPSTVLLLVPCIYMQVSMDLFECQLEPMQKHI